MRHILAVLVLSFGLTAQSDQAMQADDLIRYFSASCQSQGPWTQVAYSQASNIVETLRHLKDDPNCTSVGGALTSLNSLMYKFNEINAMAMGKEINNLRAQEAQLLLQMSQSTDPNLSYAISSSLSYVQSSLISFYSSPNLQLTTGIQQATALSEFTTASRLALNQLSQNRMCLIGHPSLLTGFASMAGAVGSTFLNPVPGLALAAGSDILSSVVEYSRKNSMSQKIKNMSSEMVRDAFSCVMESLTDQWCAAQDSLNILQLKGAVLNKELSQNDFFEGMQLLDRDLPLFLGWLEKVRAGSDATNKAESDRQKDAFQREKDVKTARTYAAGIFNDGQRLFDAATTPEKKWTEERNLADRFVNAISGLGGAGRYSMMYETTNPLFDIYSMTCAPYFLIGLDPNSPSLTAFFQGRRTSEGSCGPLSSFNPATEWPAGAPPFVLGVKEMKARAQQWVTLAEEKVRSELNLVLQPDARSIFQQARDIENGRSPYYAIQHFINFLSKQTSTINDVSAYYSNTARRLGEIRSQIEQVIAAGEDPDNSISLKALSVVYDKAQLSYGTALFRGRLEQAIRNSLNEILTNGPGINKELSALLLASRDILGEVQRSSGQDNFAYARFDILQAQQTSDRTLAAFADTFSENITSFLKSYGPRYKDLKASLCLKLMAIPEWPRKIPKELCMNEKIESFNPGWPESTRITKATFDLKHEDRACLNRNYFRASKIYQNYLQQKLNR